MAKEFSHMLIQVTGTVGNGVVRTAIGAWCSDRIEATNLLRSSPASELRSKSIQYDLIIRRCGAFVDGARDCLCKAALFSAVLLRSFALPR